MELTETWSCQVGEPEYSERAASAFDHCAPGPGPVYVFNQLWVDLLLSHRVPQLLKQGETLEGLCAILHVFSSVWSAVCPQPQPHLHLLLLTPWWVWNAESPCLVFPYRPTHWTPFICMLLTQSLWEMSVQVLWSLSGCGSCLFNTELPGSSLIDLKSQLRHLSAGIGACCWQKLQRKFM